MHTKRVPLWIPYDPETDDAEALRERIAERAEAFRADYRAYVEAYGDETTEPADPDPRIVLIQHLGLVSTGTTTKNSTVSRDLYHRAIEVMAGAQALGEFVSLDAAESFAIEYWPLELYKLAQAPPPGELQGQVALVTGGAGGIGRAIGDSLAAAGACVVAFDLDQSGAEEAVEAYGDSGLAVSGDVTSEDAVTAAFAAAVDRFGGVDIVVSNAGIASSATIEETSLDEWNRNHAILVTGYFLVAREAFSVLNQQGRGGAIVFIASKNAVVAGKSAVRVLVRQGRRAAPRALPRRGGRRERHPRQHRQPRRRAPGLAHLGLVMARGARGLVRHRPRRARGALPQAHDAGREHLPRGHRPGGPALRLPGAVGQEHGQHAQRGRRGAGGVRAVARSGERQLRLGRSGFEAAVVQGAS